MFDGAASFEGGITVTSQSHFVAKVCRDLLCFVSSLLLASCANFNTIGRSTVLPKESVAVHLDAPQRIAYSNSLGQLCAEPSPDALQAYAASLGGSFSAPTKEAASVAAALSGSAASIGLRTQSITLMRDTLYRICEAFYNKAINELDVIQMLQRSQDLTLGILAIEQLTGAIVARQALLAPTAGNTPQDLDKPIAAFEKAKKDESDKKDALDSKTETQAKLKESVAQSSKDAKAASEKAAPILAAIEKLKPQVGSEQAKLKTADAELATATDKQTKQKAKVDQIAKDLDAATTKKDQPAIDKLTAQQKTEQAQLEKDDATLAKAKSTQAEQKTKSDQAQAELKKLTDDPAPGEATKLATSLKAQQDDLKKADAAVKAAQSEYQDAQTVTGIRRTALNNVASGQLTASGSGSFSDGSSRSNIEKETIGQIATATKEIVETIIGKGRMTDTCTTFMNAYFKKPTADAGTKALLDQCGKVIEAYLKAYEAYARHYAAAADAARSPQPPMVAPTLVPEPLVVPPIEFLSPPRMAILPPDASPRAAPPPPPPAPPRPPTQPMLR